MKSIVIPEGVTIIERGGFSLCESLNSITLPKSLQTIEDAMLSYCQSLKSIDIPEGVVSIGNMAFQNCSSLSSITIPRTVTSIGEKAFQNCSGLYEVISKMVNPCILSTNVFPNYFKSEGILYIPAGTRQYYMERGWGTSFINIVEKDDSGPIWLSIIDADKGKSKLRCNPGETYTIQFEPSKGWRIHSLSFRGTDVTKWLTEDGEITTPAMSTSAELIVTYEQVSDAVKASDGESKIHVVVINDEIEVKDAPAGSAISIYDISGRLVARTKATDGTTRVSVPSVERMVVVKIGEKVVKVAR